MIFHVHAVCRTAEVAAADVADVAVKLTGAAAAEGAGCSMTYAHTPMKTPTGSIGMTEYSGMDTQMDRWTFDVRHCHTSS